MAEPHLSDKGKGINANMPHLSSKGMGINAKCDIYSWFCALSARLRKVRVVCGDWNRICGGNWQQENWPTVGIYFDPPYGVQNRDDNVYHCDSIEVAQAVEDWALERGSRLGYRIVISGYDGEYRKLLAAGWEWERWTATGGYSRIARSGKITQGQANRVREILLFSPHCLETNLFSEKENGDER